MARVTLFGKRPDPDTVEGAGSVPAADTQNDFDDPEMKTITVDSIREASQTLALYKQGKANLESRIVEDELWWQLRHWEAIGRHAKRNEHDGESKERAVVQTETTSAWLFNCLANKHADIMDNYPTAVVLPREISDDQAARTLSSVVPVVMEQNGFEEVYSDCAWEKIKHGTAVFGTFWSSEKDNGLGDIEIKGIDLLKIFWEPGITDIQKSKNLFIVDLVDIDVLDDTYPQYAGKMKSQVVDVSQYVYDDAVDTSGKALVVDWYYKVKMPNGKTVLQYVKFVGDVLLYASENDPAYMERGYYDHGEYPVVFDCLYPEKGTPVGFGLIALCKDPQIYIDKLSSNIMEASIVGSKLRYFASDSLNINEEELKDTSQPIVHVQGSIDESKLQQFKPSPLDGIYVNVLNNKIEEMKDTASNRDVNQGGTGSGVTAAAAIAALQEAGNKTSRDIIKASYRSFEKVVRLTIELMRQFYDTARSFRITEPNGQYGFAQMSNVPLRDQQIKGPDGVPLMSQDGTELYRHPIFDLKIKATKANPFSRMEQNEIAKEVYRLGMLNPDNAQPALIALNMMDFEGIDQIKQQVAQGQTLLNVCRQLSAELEATKQMLSAVTGAGQTETAAEPQNRSASGGNQKAGGKTSEGANASAETRGDVMGAQTPMTSYGQKLAERSRPSAE